MQGKNDNTMFSQKKILIVEDNQMNRMILKRILSSEYQVLEAENGQAALEVLKKRHEDISLILLDIVMPVMDGYTFLSIMKADPLYSSIPVIVTTQNDGETDEVAALSNGATDFVVKPYRPQVIRHRVASIINLRETAAMINQFQFDRLTGLFSKEFFYERAKDMLIRNPEKKYDIICSDIDNFKLINDVFGTQAGDGLLKVIADVYTSLVGDKGICGRFNADQFACLLEHQPKYTNEMFIKASAQICALSNTKNIVMKWGIYPVEDETISVEQMCDRALLAARSIKGQYGKYFAVYDDELRSALLHEQAIADIMETALEEEQFEVYLQPKYRVRDGELAGAEALVRWNHPVWGFQSPAEFIPLFEKNGFITKLDQFVWDKTCSILRRWEDRGIPPFDISVNVSRADIYNADLTGFLVKTVQKYGLHPSRIHLEITESAYTEDPNQIINTVRHLRELGFIIEMDDFGSGYSSLNMLNQMPLDILKLDMKFIQSETAKPVNEGILRFIIGLARWMDLSVVAEGVETREQLERLRDIGCDYVQGYLFAKPMPCNEFEALLKKQQAAMQERTDAGTVIYGKKFLLVADEDSQYRSGVRERFEDYFEVLEAPDAKSALDYIVRYGYKIAVAVVSMTLADSGGASVLNALQKEKAICDVPVIATGPQDEQLEEKALSLGADDFAGKPHSLRGLSKRIMRMIEIAASQDREGILEKEAYRDYLTGLLNRRGMDFAINFMKKEKMPLAVYLFDLDHLKQVNDTYGHLEGDRIIQQFGAFLQSHTRETDVLARYGGDEFIVVMKQVKSAQDMLKKGREICRAYQDNCFIKGVPAACTAGIAIWNTGDSMEEIIGGADRALYRAKKNYKGDCCLWEG